MTLYVDLSPEMQARLQALAQRRGRDMATCAREVLNACLPPLSEIGDGALDDELQDLARQIAASAITVDDVRAGVTGNTGADLAAVIGRWSADGVPDYLRGVPDAPELARALRKQMERPDPWR